MGMGDGVWDNGYSNSNHDSYDNAIICKNGHVINDYVNRYPEDNKNYCEKCGSKAISKCDNCSNPIQGNIWGGDYELPSFCYNCGGIFPWTKGKIEAAIELSEESNYINKEEKEIFVNSINEVVKDTPKSAVGATRLKKILSKIGNGTSKMIRDIIVDITSETAKKILFPDR